MNPVIRTQTHDDVPGSGYDNNIWYRSVWKMKMLKYWGIFIIYIGFYDKSV